MRYHLTLVRMTIIKSLQITNAGEGVEKKETSYTVSGNEKLLQPLWRTVWRILNKLKTEPPHDPPIPLLGIHLEITLIWRDARTQMYITALFTIAEIWKQPKCPSTDEWMKKIWYIYTMEYYSTVKNEIMSTAATWMDLEIIILNEVSQRMTNIIWYRVCVKSKIWQKWTYLWNRDGLTDTENTLMVTTGEKGWGRDRLRVWD